MQHAYFGGRCEIFGNALPSEQILYFDFPGMYQQVLMTNIPHGEYFFKIKPSTIDQPGFYYITVQYTSCMPILPIKLDKLYFPTGTITGWY